METKNITLRCNTVLIELSNYTGRSMDELKEMIISYLIENNYIYDFREECGTMLSEIMVAYDIEMCCFAEEVFKVKNKRLLGLLSGIQIWGIENDCKNCGCKMIEEEEEKVCENLVCGCKIQTVFEPDYDSMFGGRDYCIGDRLN